VAGFIGDINLFEQGAGWLAVRPERMWIAAKARGGTAFGGVVAETGYLGDWTTYVVRLADGRTVRISQPNTGGPAPFAKGETVAVGFDPAQAVELVE
jgi:putrescine transport system ATP-binding protein